MRVFFAFYFGRALSGRAITASPRRPAVGCGLFVLSLTRRSKSHVYGIQFTVQG